MEEGGEKIDEQPRVEERVVVRLRRWYVAMVGVGFLLTLLLWEFAPTLQGVWPQLPDLRYELTEEDGFVENISAFFFLLAFGIGIGAILRPWNLPGRGAHAILPFLSFLGFFDEVGYDRIFASQFYLGPYEIDAFHDLVTITFKVWRDFGNLPVDLFLLSLLGLFLIGAFLRRRTYMPRIMAWIRHYPAFDYLRYAIIFYFFSLPFDLDAIPLASAPVWEEYFEAAGALAMVFAAGLIHATRR